MMEGGGINSAEGGGTNDSGMYLREEENFFSLGGAVRAIFVNQINYAGHKRGFFPV